MTSQNNDSGVDVNIGGHEGDSDGDIVVDETPAPGNHHQSLFSVSCRSCYHWNKKKCFELIARVTADE